MDDVTSDEILVSVFAALARCLGRDTTSGCDTGIELTMSFVFCEFLLYLALATVLCILSTAPEEIRVLFVCLFSPATFEEVVALPVATEFRIAFALAIPRLVFSFGLGTTTAEVCEDGAPLDLTAAPCEEVRGEGCWMMGTASNEVFMASSSLEDSSVSSSSSSLTGSYRSSWSSRKLWGMAD